MTTALLEKQDAPQRKVAETGSENASLLGYWTADALERATEAGVFDHPERLELIHGRIIEKMPQSGLHAGLRRRLARRLRGAIEPTAFVCEECPLRLALDGEPVPDIVFTREADYGDQHPTQEDAVLVVEVSNTTMAYDLGEKALLYAEANISDYWVVLVSENAVVVHREPTPSGYSHVTRLSGADTLSALALPDAVWTIDMLLGREAAPEINEAEE